MRSSSSSRPVNAAVSGGSEYLTPGEGGPDSDWRACNQLRQRHRYRRTGIALPGHIPGPQDAYPGGHLRFLHGHAHLAEM